MDWTIKPYDEANHPPAPKLDHAARITAKPGERVDLSATGSTDPDGDALSFEWFCYAEAGMRVMSNARALMAFSQTFSFSPSLRGKRSRSDSWTGSCSSR